MHYWIIVQIMWETNLLSADWCQSASSTTLHYCRATNNRVSKTGWFTTDEWADWAEELLKILKTIWHFLVVERGVENRLADELLVCRSCQRDSATTCSDVLEASIRDVSSSIPVRSPSLLHSAKFWCAQSQQKGDTYLTYTLRWQWQRYLPSPQELENHSCVYV